MPGGSPAASTSSFSIGSVRRYISVLWMLAWPSHRDTLRMSPVASRVWTAQECLRAWGDMRLPTMDGIFCRAVATCRARRCAKPWRLRAMPRALRKRRSLPPLGRIASQSRRTDRVSRHSGNTRSRRPLPITCTVFRCGCARSLHASPVNSDTLSPACIGEMQHCPVAHAGGGCGIRRVEQGSQFVAVEVVDQRLVEAFRRYRVHLPGKVETSRSPMFQVPEEGFERHESQIARAIALPRTCSRESRKSRMSGTSSCSISIWQGRTPSRSCGEANEQRS